LGGGRVLLVNMSRSFDIISEFIHCMREMSPDWVDCYLQIPALCRRRPSITYSSRLSEICLHQQSEMFEIHSICQYMTRWRVRLGSIDGYLHKPAKNYIKSKFTQHLVFPFKQELVAFDPSRLVNMPDWIAHKSSEHSQKMFIFS
jgi:hypothetical protein